MYVNNIKTSSTKLLFDLGTTVKAKSVVLKQAKISTNDHQIDMKTIDNSIEGTRMDINDLVVTFKMSLVKLLIGPLEKMIDPPVELGKKEFDI